MKYIWVIIGLLIFNTAFSQFTDCKEYGFKGNLKKVYTYTYIDLEKKNNKWEIDENNLYSIWDFSIDENHNFDKMKITIYEYHYPEDFFYEIKFKNGLKHSYIKLDSSNKVIHDMKFIWLNDKTYKSIVEINETFIETLHILNDEYRDYITESKVYDDSLDIISPKNQTTS